MAHMSLGICQDAVASTALVADISLLMILQVCDWARVSTPDRHCFYQCISLPLTGT